MIQEELSVCFYVQDKDTNKEFIFLQIGSIAGFEDGSFESARLRRPSSIIFDSKRRCLYIADCEVRLAPDCPKHLRIHSTLPSRELPRGTS